MLLVKIVVGTIIFYFLTQFVITLYKKIRVLWYLHKLPGPPKYNVIIGNIDKFFGTPDEVFETHAIYGKKYFPIYKAWAAHECAVNLMTPEDFELVLSNNQHNSKSSVYDILHNWLAEGLLTSNGKKWQTRRHILTPAFHFTILQEFLTIFNEESDNVVNLLRNQTDKDLDVNKFISLFTLKTIGETSMGTKIESTGLGLDYRYAVEQISISLLYRFLRPWLWYRIVYIFTKTFYQERKLLKSLHKFTKHVIKERENDFSLKKLKSKRMAMLDLLLKVKHEQQLIDDKGIQEEVDTFMFEGHDTTSSALTFCLMLIACNKHVQDNLVDEINSVLGDKEKPTYQDLQELKYMERTLKESLRMYPSVYFISRVLGADMTTNSGHLLPSGTMVILQIHTMHHNERIYPDPEKFDPDRFLPENVEKRHRFAYTPFSAGARNCIGQRFALLEMKSVLCGILKNFILEPVDTPETIRLVTDIVLRSVNPIRVKFQPRY